MTRVEHLHALEDNYIYVVQYDGPKAFVVDPGDADPVLAYAVQEGLQITTVFNTHYHFDHVDGNDRLKDATGCDLIGPDKGRIRNLDRVVGTGDHIALGPVTIDVISTPGHTETDVCYLLKRPAAEGSPILWTGDTLFVGGCGRLFGGGAKALYGSLNRLAALPEDTLVYCSHEYGALNLRFAISIEPDNAQLQARYRQLLNRQEQGRPTLPSSIGEERRSNIFLRADAEEVKAALHMEQADPFEVFAELRRRKDRFQ